MADKKITELVAATSILSTDILTVVTDPGGSPVNKKITTGNLAASILEVASPAGKGIVLTTPDGSHTYRISIDNDGVVTTEQLT